MEGSTQNRSYANVILPLPLDGLFTYSIPRELEGEVRPFVRVKVPFGITKTHTALVVSVHNNPPEPGITVKPLISVLDSAPVLLPGQYRLWEWIASYYMCPLGDIMVAALPAGIKNEDHYRPRTETYVRLGDKALPQSLVRSPKQLEVFNKFLELGETSRQTLQNATSCSPSIIKALVDNGFLALYDKEVGRLNTSGDYHPERIKPLSEAQQRALANLSPLTSNLSALTKLLHGITSSGKTEIYIHLIKEAIERGEQVMYLLPEIALTVQITQRLQHVFGSRLGIYHSKYSDAERVEIWQKQLSSSPYDVILGARSAVFLPYQRLGLVIIDEEHETSFKQQEPAPRYHARSVAMMMASWAKARVVLGTATPSVESYYNAQQGKYQLVELRQRYRDLQLPLIHVIDTKDLRHRKIMTGLLSPQLASAVHEALGRGEQAIIFQNRRGFSPVVECHQCGWSPKCPHCDVSLTYHKTTDSLSCHYCGYTMKMPTQCPDCGNRELRDRGAGTEKVEDYFRLTFPEARIARMDLDTTRTRNAYERIIAEFSAGKTNLLIGTQMVTKGLDFDRVSVVGIISADTMLHQPDFRAYEHAFQMMTQVAGRAGRKGRRGQVFIQTTHPELPVIRHILKGDYEAFFQSVIRERRAFRYPPLTRLIYVYLKHKDERTVDSAAIELASRLRQAFPARVPGQALSERVLGPDKPAVSRIKTLYIRKVMLKLESSLSITASRQAIRQAVAALMQDPRYKSLLIYYDVDPE
ncbi:MAG: primosomal protein N' [Prevotella sp.]|nr:primosomal protein N' [Prevotella sp.]